MQCEQVRQYLDQYAEGSLPGYKAAWVVQHLAGCQTCAAAAGEARRHRTRPADPVPAVVTRREMAATATPAENSFEPVQRPVPRWLQWATAVLIMAAAGGAVWLLLEHPVSASTPPKQHTPADRAIPKVGAIWSKHG